MVDVLPYLLSVLWLLRHLAFPSNLWHTQNHTLHLEHHQSKEETGTSRIYKCYHTKNRHMQSLTNGKRIKEMRMTPFQK